MLLNSSSAKTSDKRAAVMFGLPFFLIGIGLVLGNDLFPLRYPAKSTEQLLSKYQSTLPVTSETESSTLKNFVQKDQAIIVDGRALYPVYLKANEGVLNYNWLSYSFKPYNRLAFYLIGVRSFNVNLPMESPPPSFPDGSDVIVIGCLAEAGEINALSVLIQGSSPIRYINDPFPAPDCPLSAP